jgi:hypothetical protein
VRPLRALAVVAVLVAGWVIWRVPVAQAQLEAMRAALGVPAQPLMHGSAPLLLMTLRPEQDTQLCLGGVPLPTAVRVMPTADPIVTALLVEDDPWPQLALRVPHPPGMPSGPGPATATFAESDAEAGYRLLAAGDRRGAGQALRRAVAGAPADPRATQWSRQLAVLERRWSGDAYVLARGAGPAALTALSPVLGAGQTGASLGWTLDPHATRPVAVAARVAVAHDGWGIDGDTAQFGIGLRWRPRPGATLAVERMVAGGDGARDAWTARAAWGAGDGQRWSLYSEAGVVGARRRDVYAAAQGYAGHIVAGSGRRTLAIGGGGWASVQAAGTTVSRVDLGPTLRVRLSAGDAGIDIAADYRLRVTGNAAPKDGVAVTVSAFY